MVYILRVIGLLLIPALIGFGGTGLVSTPMPFYLFGMGCFLLGCVGMVLVNDQRGSGALGVTVVSALSLIFGVVMGCAAVIGNIVFLGH